MYWVENDERRMFYTRIENNMESLLRTWYISQHKLSCVARSKARESRQRTATFPHTVHYGGTLTIENIVL